MGLHPKHKHRTPVEEDHQAEVEGSPVERRYQAEAQAQLQVAALCQAEEEIGLSEGRSLPAERKDQLPLADTVDCRCPRMDLGFEHIVLARLLKSQLSVPTASRDGLTPCTTFAFCQLFPIMFRHCCCCCTSSCCISGRT